MLGYYNKPEETQAQACEQAAILISLENLLSYPWIRRRVEEGSLALHGWYFDMERGELLQYRPESARFEVLVPNLSLHGEATFEPIVTPGI